MEQARALDEELRSGKDRGPLHGVPIGIKDIIDVEGLPTACGGSGGRIGSPKGMPTVVANLREAGAVIMGKTVTTPYAWIDPPPREIPGIWAGPGRFIERLGGGRGLRDVLRGDREPDGGVDH